MGKKSKGTKRIVGSANVNAARGKVADGASGEFAVEGMGLQAQPTGAVGGSGEEITSAEASGPPARSTLDDVASQPAEVDLMQLMGETTAAALTAEQQGDATRAAFEKDARVKRAARLKATGEAQRAEGLLRRGGAAPGEGEEERTGLGVGYGVFDAVYETPADEMPPVRHGRNYVDTSRWIEEPEVSQDWESRLSGLKDECGCQNVTALPRTLGQTLEQTLDSWQVLFDGRCCAPWQVVWQVLCSKRHGKRQWFVGMACAGACMACNII